MRRAEVYRTDRGRWEVLTYDPSRNRPYEANKSHHRIAGREEPVGHEIDPHPTHAEALTAALAAVGLDVPETHREAP